MTNYLKQYLQENNYKNFDLKAVLFDMDGVLYDSMPAHAQSWQETMEDFGFKNTKPEDFYLHEGRVGDSTINMIYEEELNRPATEEEKREIYARKSELFTRYNSGAILEGSGQIVEMVKENGLLPVLVTGSGQPTLLDKLNDNFPDTFVRETMVTAFDVEIGKPHPEPFLMGLQKGGDLRPNQAIVIENAPLGTEAAHRAGIFTIAVNTGPLADKILWDSGANMVLHSMEELHEVFPKLLSEIRSVTV